MNLTQLQALVEELKNEIDALKEEDKKNKEQIKKLQSSLDNTNNLLLKHRHLGYDNSSKI